jgi:hypothetical protein
VVAVEGRHWCLERHHGSVVVSEKMHHPVHAAAVVVHREEAAIEQCSVPQVAEEVVVAHLLLLQRVFEQLRRSHESADPSVFREAALEVEAPDWP